MSYTGGLTLPKPRNAHLPSLAGPITRVSTPLPDSKKQRDKHFNKQRRDSAHGVRATPRYPHPPAPACLSTPKTIRRTPSLPTHTLPRHTPYSRTLRTCPKNVKNGEPYYAS